MGVKIVPGAEVDCLRLGTVIMFFTLHSQVQSSITTKHSLQTLDDESL